MTITPYNKCVSFMEHVCMYYYVCYLFSRCYLSVFLINWNWKKQKDLDRYYFVIFTIINIIIKKTKNKKTKTTQLLQISIRSLVVDLNYVFLKSKNQSLSPVLWWGPCCSSFQFFVLCFLALSVFVLCLVPYVVSVSGLSTLDCPFGSL